MRIIFLTPHPPYPPHRGDQLIAYEQLRNLDNLNYKIYLVSLFHKQNEEKEILENLSEHCKAIFFIKVNKINMIFSMLKTLYNFKPIQVNMYSIPSVKKQLLRIIDNINPDLIHLQTIRLSEIVINIDIPKVLDMIDILSLNMRRRAKKESIFLKIGLFYESFLLKIYENKIINKFTNISVVSENDLIISKLRPNKKIFVNPNGTSILKDQKKIHIKEKIIIFHGNMSYYPNIEAMDYFILKIWPRVLSKYNDYKLYVVGKNPPEKIKLHNGINNICITGFVDDISEYLCKSQIGVYPLRSGTGMQNKILEALASGLPIVATDFALQGIRGVSDNQLLTANSIDEILYSIGVLIENQELRKKFENNGPLFIKDNFSWNKNVELLEKIWIETIN